MCKTKMSSALEKGKSEIIMYMFLELAYEQTNFHWSSKKLIHFYTDIVDKHADNKYVDADMTHVEIVRFLVNYIYSLQDVENFKKWLYHMKTKNLMICDFVPTDSYFFADWLLPFDSMIEAYICFNENVKKMKGVRYNKHDTQPKKKMGVK